MAYSDFTLATVRAAFDLTSLGDTDPALGNFLRLTSLTLAVPQLALTVQVGDAPVCSV